MAGFTLTSSGHSAARHGTAWCDSPFINKLHTKILIYSTKKHQQATYTHQHTRILTQSHTCRYRLLIGLLCAVRRKWQLKHALATPFRWRRHLGRHCWALSFGRERERVFSMQAAACKLPLCWPLLLSKREMSWKKLLNWLSVLLSELWWNWWLFKLEPAFQRCCWKCVWKGCMVYAYAIFIGFLQNVYA